MEEATKIVYLMRGLPSCGKSTTAKKLAGENGVVCETDDFYFSQVGEDPNKYDFSWDLYPQAKLWNFNNFKQAIADNAPRIVVDRGNSLCVESKKYALYAKHHGYELVLAEPESEWWQEIKVLLKYKKYTTPVLKQWADKLAQMNRSTHRVPPAQIFDWMKKWKWDLTVEEILNFVPKEEKVKARVEAIENNPRVGAVDIFNPG